MGFMTSGEKNVELWRERTFDKYCGIPGIPIWYIVCNSLSE